MAIIVKSADEDTISIPARLMATLRLREGERVNVLVNGDTLRFARLDQFLKLRGALADDEAFDRAIEWIEQAWQTWAAPLSA